MIECCISQKCSPLYIYIYCMRIGLRQSGRAPVFTPEGLADISMVLSDGIAAETRYKYDGRGLPLLREYLMEVHGFTEEEANSRAALLHGPGEDEVYQRYMLLLFIVWLQRQGLTVCQINERCKALRRDFQNAGHRDLAEMISSKEFMVARHHGERANPREAQKAREERQTSELTPEMFDYIFNECWLANEASPFVEDTDEAMAAIAIFFMLACTLRVSNVARTRSTVHQDRWRGAPRQQLVDRGVLRGGAEYDDHIGRAEDLFFWVELHMSMENLTEAERISGDVRIRVEPLHRDICSARRGGDKSSVQCTYW